MRFGHTNQDCVQLKLNLPKKELTKQETILTFFARHSVKAPFDKASALTKKRLAARIERDVTNFIFLEMSDI